MKFNLMSDLHLEFAPMVPTSGGEILLLSGDITVATTLSNHRTDKTYREVRKRTKKFFDEISNKYQKIFWIAGNHEHYHGVWEETYGLMKDFVKDSNIQVLQNETVNLSDDLTLFGATMWTNFHNSDPIAMLIAKNGMNDYRLIAKTNNTYFHPEDSFKDYHNTSDILTSVLIENPNKKFVVMTHHTPSYQSIHPKYGNDPMNYAYSSDLDDFIVNHPNILVWTHGHTHDSFDYKIAETRIVCNTRGYANPQNPVKTENEKFNVDFTFEV